MELATVGRVFNPGFAVPLWVNGDEAIEPDLHEGSRFRIIFAQAGSGLIDLGERQLVLIAPALLCLNEVERPKLARNQGLKARAVYFHPSITNGSFDFETLRSGVRPDGWKESDWQDRHLLEVFIERPGTCGTHGDVSSQLMGLGPDSVHQVTRLLRSMAQVLDEQADDYWPCRSRSYLLELLFLVDRLRREPRCRMASLPAELVGPPPAGPVSSDDVEGLILYLHTHYPEKITLDQLAREFHSNRTTLSERFRTATGQPVMTYLAQLRIRVAAMMLHDTLLPVSEIAARTGFLDLTHFGRAFRKSTGETPTDFRDRTCWMVE